MPLCRCSSIPGEPTQVQWLGSGRCPNVGQSIDLIRCVLLYESSQSCHRSLGVDDSARPVWQLAPCHTLSVVLSVITLTHNIYRQIQKKTEDRNLATFTFLTDFANHVILLLEIYSSLGERIRSVQNAAVYQEPGRRPPYRPTEEGNAKIAVYTKQCLLYSKGWRDKISTRAVLSHGKPRDACCIIEKQTRESIPPTGYSNAGLNSKVSEQKH